MYRTSYIVGGEDKTNFSRMGMHSFPEACMRNGDELETKIFFSPKNAS